MKEPNLSFGALMSLSILSRIGPRHKGLTGADIIRVSNLQSGFVYPCLYRLEKYGWLQSTQENGDARELGRPLKRFYRMTKEGRAKFKAKMKELELV